MSSSIYDDDLVVRFPGDTVRELVARRFGPAGVVAVELQPGLMVAVDAVDPSLLASITVDLATDCRDVLADLIGESRTESLQQLKASANGRPGRLRAEADEWENARRAGFQSRPDPNDRAELTGRCISHLAVARSTSKDELVRLVSALEGLDAVDDMWQRNGLSDLLLGNAIEVAKQLAQEVDTLDELMRQLDSDLRSELGELLERHVGKLPELRAIESGSDPNYRAEVAASMIEVVAPESARDGSAPRGQRPRLKRALRESDQWLELSFGRFRPDYWIRVLHPATQELVTLVPLKRGPRNTGVGHVLIPPDHLATKNFAYDVTLTPIRIPDDAVSTVINGVRMGYKALDLSRRGARYEAFKLWEECADLWQRVGDSARARLAREYGRDGVPALVNTLSARVDQSSHFEP